MGVLRQGISRFTSGGVRLALAGVLVAACLPAPAHATGRCGPHPWCDSSLSPDSRAGLLLGELTQDEKVSLLGGDDPGMFTSGHTGISKGVTRVDLPTAYFTDGPVGVRQGSATAMPTPMGLAATFDPTMALRYGGLVANEPSSRGMTSSSLRR
jgi:beta-glucosidase